MEGHHRKFEGSTYAEQGEANQQHGMAWGIRRRPDEELGEIQTAGAEFDEADSEQDKGGGHAGEDEVFQPGFLGLGAVARVGDHADHRKRHGLQAQE
jgi:hypothetical protein